MSARKHKVVKDQGPVQSAGSTCEDFGKVKGCEGNKSAAYFLWGEPPITLCLRCFRELVGSDAKETKAEAPAETKAHGLLKRKKGAAGDNGAQLVLGSDRSES